MSTRPFDEVVLRRDGQTTRLDPEQFLRIPLTQRVRYLLCDALEFRLLGEIVPTKAALKGLAAPDPEGR